MIHVENLSKKFELQKAPRATSLKEALGSFFCRGEVSQKADFWALRDISFSVNPGDRIGVIGNNGAGKSTLLKILSRIYQPTVGKITIVGRIASLLEVGTGFHPELSGRENIYLNGAILGMTSREIDARFDAIVAFAELDKFLETPVKRYSSGMFARLGFSIAAHLDPDILIVDEVLSVGDLSFQERCLQKLSNLSSEGKTVLFVSHNLGAVLSLCNRGIYIEEGRIAAIGPIESCASVYLQRIKTSRDCWEGDLGDDRASLRRFAWTSFSKCEYVTQGEEVEISMQVEVKKMASGLIFGFDLLSHQGVPLASARTSENPALHSFLSSPGRYTLTFKLPTAFLREGEYRLVAVCLIHNDRHLIQDSIMLTLPIYPDSADSRFRHPHRGQGLFLGDRWQWEENCHG